ncbi:hypothetical protein Tco_0708203 [Tanacetum coccineum]
MAAPGGNNQVARRVIDDLIEFSGETSVDGYMSFFKSQQIAETRSFINRMHDEVNTARNLFGQLTALIAEVIILNARIKLQVFWNKLVNDAEAEVEEKEAQVMGMIYVCVKNELCMDVLLFDPYTFRLLTPDSEYIDSSLPVILFVNGDLIFLFRLLPVKTKYVCSSKQCFMGVEVVALVGVLFRLPILFIEFRSRLVCLAAMNGAYVTDGCYAKAEDQAFSGLISNIYVALRISLSKKQKLIAELEAVGDEEGVAKGLENLTVVVARDTATLGDLEHLLARSQVGVALKAGFVNDMQPMQ